MEYARLLKKSEIIYSNSFKEFAVQIYFAYRGQVTSLLRLTPCGVLPDLFFPQVSSYIRTALCWKTSFY